MEIYAIDYWRNIVTKIDELFAPPELLLFVTGAKRDVMHRPGRHTPNAGIGKTKQIDNSTRDSIVMRCEPKPVTRFLDQPVTERVSEQTRRLFIAFQSSRHTMESTKRVLRLHRAIGPTLN